MRGCEVVFHVAAHFKLWGKRALFDQVNVEGTRNVARACQKSGCVFVYLSTDYVFDGESARPYLPTDPPCPLGVYGRTKWEGEIAAQEAERALIVRTSWLYGAGGKHFVDTISRLAAERARLDIVDDQIGRPTWTEALAETLDKLLKAGSLGTFHASGAGDPVSWAGFAEEIVRRLRLPVEIRRIATSELDRPARRPRYSVLDLAATEAVTGPLGDWKDALARYLEGRGDER